MPKKTMPSGSKRTLKCVLANYGKISTQRDRAAPLAASTAAAEPATEPTATEATEPAAAEAAKSVAGRLKVLRPHHAPVVHLVLSFQVLPGRGVVHRAPCAVLALLPAALPIPPENIPIPVGHETAGADTVEYALPVAVDIIIMKETIAIKLPFLP